ncbi:MAG: preprotein translocase subunit YajC [Bacteroidetes bacterium RBG_13_42_15]|nr:MAG: preprotein translocase subunit YajC [Bacteroidetes bacterium RBG_13_42_15]
MGTSGGSQTQGGNPLMGFLPLVLIIFIMYFLMIRPQAKKQKEHKAMITSLEKGDKIMTSGGIVGIIQGVKDSEGLLIIKIADNVKIELSRTAVAQVIKKKSE